ncbi:hypothetical protein EDD16DRAFT_1519533 [Pisolithus croceorrhizus]|nr:hypothetical protein EDD16DRAFT_1519533 [Pisolithus croceorrhizus]
MKTTLADETKPRYVGPVDPSQFLDNYLPCSNSSPAAPCLNEKEFDTLRGGRYGNIRKCISHSKQFLRDMLAFHSQFQFFAFSLVIFGNHARFVRWGCGGAVISARFTYVEHSNILVDFFWGFSHFSPEGRGHDPSVSPANLSEEDAKKAGTALLFAFGVPRKDEDCISPSLFAFLLADQPARLVLAFVGRRLAQFKCTKKLAWVVLHAMKAHWTAFKKAKVLRRDISVNNILITRLLHALEDGIESFVHVLGWTILCHLPGPMDGNCRRGWVSLLYDHGWKDSFGREEGGHSKAYAVRTPGAFPDSGAIQALASPFQACYGKAPTASQIDKYQCLKEKFDDGLCDLDDVEDHPAHMYFLGMERPSNSEWFLSTIQDELERPGWRDKDGASKKLVAITEGTSRQKQRAIQRGKYQHNQGSATAVSADGSWIPRDRSCVTFDRVVSATVEEIEDYKYPITTPRRTGMENEWKCVGNLQFRSRVRSLMVRVLQKEDIDILYNISHLVFCPSWRNSEWNLENGNPTSTPAKTPYGGTMTTTRFSSHWWDGTRSKSDETVILPGQKRSLNVAESSRDRYVYRAYFPERD